MLNKFQYFVLTALAVMALLLTVGDMVLYSTNRAVNSRIADRGQYIQQSLQIQPVYEALLKNLVALAARNNDEQLRQLLASQGITFEFNPRNPGQGGGGADGGEGGKANER